MHTDQPFFRRFLEGVRLHGMTTVQLDAASAGAVRKGSQTTHLAANSRIMVNPVAAARDPAIFPDPEAVYLNRPSSAYAILHTSPTAGWVPTQVTRPWAPR